MKKKIVFVIIAVFIITNITAAAFGLFVPLFQENQSALSEWQDKMKQVSISDEVSAKIDGQTKSGKLETFYRKMVVEKQISGEQVKKLDDLILRYENTKDVLIAYDFAYEWLLTYTQLEEMLLKRGDGVSFPNLFQDYINLDDAYVPRVFENGVLEGLMTGNHLNENDIALADILSQRGIADFDEILTQRKQNHPWKK